MKTSNKFLVAACVVLVVALAFYNTTLQAEYRTGTFRDPLKNFVTLTTKDFDVVEMEAASLAGVSIQPGPYSVRVFEPLSEVLQVQQHGRRLTLKINFPRESRSFMRWAGKPAIVITCPTLLALRADATYSVNGQVKTDHSQRYYSECPVTVQGFRQDSLSIRADNATQVDLRNNTLGHLRVVAGHEDGTPVLRLHSGNQIQQASLLMGGKSRLVFDELTIPDLRYQFSDSATTTLPGRSISALLPHNGGFR